MLVSFSQQQLMHFHKLSIGRTDSNLCTTHPSELRGHYSQKQCLSSSSLVLSILFYLTNCYLQGCCYASINGCCVCCLKQKWRGSRLPYRWHSADIMLWLSWQPLWSPVVALFCPGLEWCLGSSDVADTLDRWNSARLNLSLCLLVDLSEIAGRDIWSWLYPCSTCHW